MNEGLKEWMCVAAPEEKHTVYTWTFFDYFYSKMYNSHKYMF